jgi:ribosomal-protein-alanine N-acetyltransferase
MFPLLETDRILMREITNNDIDDMYCYYSNTIMMKYTKTNPHQSKEETLARIIKLSNSFKNNKGIAWAIESKTEKRVIGDIGLYYITADHKKAGVGFNIAQEYWNNGYGTEALIMVLNYAVYELNIQDIEATCKIDNIASAKVMEKAGMKYDGTFSKYSNKVEKNIEVKKYSFINNKQN